MCSTGLRQVGQDIGLALFNPLLAQAVIGGREGKKALGKEMAPDLQTPEEAPQFQPEKAAESAIDSVSTRRKRLQQALMSGLGGTVATSPLGLSGQASTTKTMLGS